MKDNEGGHVIMVIANGEGKYDGTFQNKIQSISFGAAARSVIFKIAAPIQRVNNVYKGNLQGQCSKSEI